MNLLILVLVLFLVVLVLTLVFGFDEGEASNKPTALTATRPTPRPVKRMEQTTGAALRAMQQASVDFRAEVEALTALEGVAKDE